MNVDSLSVSFIIHPVALIDISIDMSELSESMGSIVFPISFIAGSVGPDLLSVAVSEATDPLTSVLSASRIGVSWSLLSFSIGIVRHICDSLFQLDGRKVSTVSSFGLLNQRDLHAS